MILEGILWRMLRVSFCWLKIDENVVTYNKMIGNFCVVIVIIYLDNRSNLQFMYEKWIETVVIWNFTLTYSKLETFCIHFHLIWTNICIFIGIFQVKLLSVILEGILWRMFSSTFCLLRWYMKYNHIWSGFWSVDFRQIKIIFSLQT